MLLALIFYIILSILAILSVAVFLYSCLVLWNRYKHRHLPCPKPVSFFWGHMHVLKDAVDHQGQMVDLFTQWAHEFGSVYVIYNLHMPWVVTWNPNAVKEILVTGNFHKSEVIYSRIANIFGFRFIGQGLVSDMNNSSWSQKRQQMNPAFHKVSLKELISDFNSVADSLITTLGNFAGKNENIELCAWLHRTTLGIICKVAYGQELDTMGKDSPFNDAISIVMKMLGENMRDMTLTLPFMAWSKKRQFGRALDYVKETGKQWIEERERALANDEYVPDDILNSLIKMKDKVVLENYDVMDDFLTFFVAGHETTANTLSFMLMEIGRRPEIMKRMYDEVDEVLGKKPNISYEDVGKLDYINLVWKETLRLYPIAPFIFRQVDQNEFYIDGYHIPKGTTTLTSSYVSSRMPELVKDPLEFKPERFSPNSLERPNTYSYYPFSLGPRNCIGQNFANLEGRIIVAKFLQNFSFKLDPNQSFGVSDYGTLRPTGSVRAKLSWRETF